MKLPGITLFDLTGRVAIVTGGSKGLGKAMAAGLASAGASLVLASRNQSELDVAVSEIQSDFGVACIGVATDVAEQSQTEHLAAETLAKFGRIDVLINSAGINIRGPIDEISLDQFREVQRVNVDGTWLACRAVLPAMKEAGRGRIINLASTLGDRRSRQSHALHFEQRRRGSNDSRACVGTCSVQHHGQRDLPWSVSNSDERTDRRKRRSKEVYRRRGGTESLGTARRNPRLCDLSRERRGELYHGKHDGRRRRMDNEITTLRLGLAAIPNTPKPIVSTQLPE